MPGEDIIFRMIATDNASGAVQGLAGEFDSLGQSAREAGDDIDDAVSPRSLDAGGGADGAGGPGGGGISLLSLGSIGAALAAGAGALAKSGVTFVTDTADFILEIDKLANFLGASPEDTSGLVALLGKYGFELEDLKGLIGPVHELQQLANEDWQSAAGILGPLGINVVEFRNSDPDGALRLLINALAEIPTEERRAAAAFELFGEEAPAALALVEAALTSEDGSLDSALDEVKDTSFTVTEGMVKDAQNLKEAQTETSDAFKTAWAEALPEVTELLNAFSTFWGEWGDEVVSTAEAIFGAIVSGIEAVDAALDEAERVLDEGIGGPTAEAAYDAQREASGATRIPGVPDQGLLARFLFAGNANDPAPAPDQNYLDTTQTIRAIAEGARQGIQGARISVDAYQSIAAQQAAAGQQGRAGGSR